MKSLRRSSDQRHRLNRVLNFAYRHVDEDIDLERLSDIACLSKFHFARCFNAHFGEPPMQFLWRIRMEHAARNLLYRPQDSITQIALNSGFSSPQGFSQIFKKRFRVSPRSFKQSNLDKANRLRKPDEPFHWPKAATPDANWQLPVRIEQRPEYRVAYVRHVGPYMGQSCQIDRAYRILYSWAKSRNLVNDDTVGISLCPDHSAFTPHRHCVYDAGIAVPSDFPEDDVVSIQTIPAGLYAVLKVACEDREMEYVWEWLTSVWLPVSGKTREVLPSYEYYPPAPGKGITAENGVELCIRLKSP